MDYDQNVERENDRLCREWLAHHEKIRKSREIESWLSHLRDGQQAHLAGTKSGSFNWCNRVKFEDGIEWIIRFSIAGKAKRRDEKVTREVSTIKLLKSSTDIPVPKVHFWGLSADNPLGLGPFIIMDFVEGMSFEEWSNNEDIPENELRIHFRGLALIYYRLSDLSFPSACSPILDELGEVTYHSPLTIKMQEIEAHTTTRLGKISILFNDLG
jgi:hypothetical protein